MPVGDRATKSGRLGAVAAANLTAPPNDGRIAEHRSPRMHPPNH